MPVLARVYLIPPGDQPTLKLRQFRAIQRDYQQVLAEKEG